MDAEVRTVEMKGASFTILPFVQAHLRNSFVENLQVYAEETIIAAATDLLTNGVRLIEDVQFDAIKLLGDELDQCSLLAQIQPIANRKLTFEMDRSGFKAAISAEGLMSIPQVLCAQEIRFIISVDDEEVTLFFAMLKLSSVVLRLPHCDRMLIRLCEHTPVTADQLAASFVKSFEQSKVVDTMAKIIDLEVHHHGPRTKSALPGKPSLSGVRFTLPDSPDRRIRSRKRKCDVYHYKKRFSNEWLTAIAKRGECFQLVRLQRGKWEPAQPKVK